MNTKKYLKQSLLILPICLFLFSCGDKKQPEKKIEQKSKAVNRISKISDTKEKDFLATEKTQPHSSAANSEHVSMMANAQEERMKLAEMLPEEIREKIEKMLAERDIDGLATMSAGLFKIGDYDNAILIASNFLACAETDTEKQMADSFYANLVAKVFTKQNRFINDANKEEYQNVITLLTDSLNKTPGNVEINQASIVATSMKEYAHIIIRYERNIDKAYQMYDEISDKIQNHQSQLGRIRHAMFWEVFIPLQFPKNYKKFKMKKQNVKRLLEFTEKMISGEYPSLPKNSPLTPQKCKTIIKNYEQYQQKENN